MKIRWEKVEELMVVMDLLNMLLSSQLFTNENPKMCTHGVIYLGTKYAVVHSRSDVFRHYVWVIRSQTVSVLRIKDNLKFRIKLGLGAFIGPTFG
jgi:hypothetical protein